MQTNPTTNPQLPAPVAGYFANKTKAIADCFTEDAVVVDERHEHRGRAAIAAWSATSRAKYSFTTEPLTVRSEGKVSTVSAKVTGTFPGSPVELRFKFTVDGGLIARLEITP